MLEQNGTPFQVIEYLKDMPTKSELTELIRKLNMSAEELIRKNEQVFKDNYKSKQLTEEECIDAMLANPKLIQRPILVVGDKAVVGRPLENFNALL